MRADAATFGRWPYPRACLTAAMAAQGACMGAQMGNAILSGGTEQVGTSAASSAASDTASTTDGAAQTGATQPSAGTAAGTDPTGATAGGGTTMPTPPTTPTTPPPPTTPAAPFNCDEATYPVCDGFETVAAGKPPNPMRWNSQVKLPPPGDGAVHSDHPADNIIEVSDKMAHTGTRSLHIHSSPGWAHLPIQAITSTAYPKDFFPAPNNTFYVRLWLYNDGLAGDHRVAVGSGHWYVVNASGPLSGRQ